MKTLNLGILAHVDAGKTSLTERLLHATGVIDRIGSVDRGTTQTDTLELERQRGITIQSAVVSFTIGELTVNLIDTPGHSDFIAEVERALRVLDGAVLVVSAVEGVQPQTRILLRTLESLRIPTLLFVNKIDRTGAAYAEILAQIKRKLGVVGVPMSAVADVGTRSARTTAIAPDRWVETLAENSDELLASYVDGREINAADNRRELARQTAACLVRPVFFGSAVTGAGVEALIEGIHDLLPAADGDNSGPLSARIFKIERSPAGEKLAYARVLSGSVRTRQRVDWQRGSGKVTSLQVFQHGGAVPATHAVAGQIVKLGGLPDIRIGDQIGLASAGADSAFAPPTLETVVTAADSVGLFLALQNLADRDPLIAVRRNDNVITVRLYGEVQKEVIASQLATEFGVEVGFAETRTIHVERPAGVGHGLHELTRHGPILFPAGIGLRVEPGEGVDYRMEVELGSLPLSFHTAIEETVRHELRHGLFGWEVTDVTVTLTHSGFWSPVSTAGDFRQLTPIVLRQALEAAGTQVYEPMHHFDLEVPDGTLAAVLGRLAECGAQPRETVVRDGVCLLEGVIPAGRVHDFERQLPSASQGEGVLRTRFAGFRRVAGQPRDALR
ncbi:elongation factor G [Fodinicola acaciae]|uniref:elongation factor G n=1 Tax=Fodinicola acaciae TaxID=2681555 RepID=UPI0013D505C0|nr:TetM/TetW/TetO/TetS family tetracycline resistance ribosomal protection protein [Fodinicola acaciae]